MLMDYLRLATVASLALTSVACGTTTQGTLHKGKEAAADLLLPPEQEEALGDQFSAELEKEITLHPDPEVQKYIQDLAVPILRQARSEAPGIKFEIKVIQDDETVNAFAMAGGQLYFYTGLLLMADSEAEVIGVIGHEVAHVTERHIAEQLVASYGLQTVVGMALGENPGQLAAMAAGVAGQGALLKFGRDQERQADDRGFEYVVKAGYDPGGMVTFFKKLAAKSASVPVFMSSHPDPAERAQKLQAKIGKLSSRPTKTGKGTYENFKKKLTASAPAPAAAEPAAAP